ncbi:MAG: transposase [Chromatiales bacterium]
MAVIAQSSLFSWDAVEARSDLDRFELVRDHLPDERIVQYLEVMRGNGRDDFPVRAMWNLLLAGVVFQHAGIESLLRELARNPSLLQACGFDPLPVQRKPGSRVVTDAHTGVRRLEAGGARRAALGGALELEERWGRSAGWLWACVSADRRLRPGSPAGRCDRRRRSGNRPGERSGA